MPIYEHGRVRFFPLKTGHGRDFEESARDFISIHFSLANIILFVYTINRFN